MVPLMMPAIHSMRLAVSPSRSALMIGHAAGDRRLEGHHHALRLRRREDFVAVRGQQRLVGRHHVLAVLDRREHQILRHRRAADQFDHDVDVRIADHRERVVRHLGRVADERARTGQILVGDHRRSTMPRPARRSDLLLVPAQHVERAAADRADAEQTHVDRFHLNSFLKENAVMTKPSRK